jgi:hypothetical protein
VAAYDDAVRELYQVPHATFVTERKRLATELKTAGDKAGATKLGKLPRPPISAWAVNQLWWKARDAFDKLLETAERLREGDLGGTAAHREALATLRQRAATILGDAGNAAAESTLRRIQTTLSAIAATGGFDPDPPGALSDDRDPPGFEAAGIPGLAAAVKAEPAETADDDGEARSRNEAAEAKRRAEAESKAEQAAAAAERRKAEQEAAKRTAERHRHEAALRTARGEVERRERELARLQKAVEEAEAAVEKSKGIVVDLEAKLEELGE